MPRSGSGFGNLRGAPVMYLNSSLLNDPASELTLRKVSSNL